MQCNCCLLRCSRSIACRRCSSYIFILDLTPGCNGLAKTTVRLEGKPFKFWDVLRFILEAWRYTEWHSIFIINEGVLRASITPPRSSLVLKILISTLRPRQNGRHFADDTFKRIFVNKNVRIFIEISLKFVPRGPINNIPALVQIMAWRRPGDRPLSEPMIVCLPTHICVTRPQWVRILSCEFLSKSYKS